MQGHRSADEGPGPEEGADRQSEGEALVHTRIIAAPRRWRASFPPCNRLWHAD
jgi:hypothetical protein